MRVLYNGIAAGLVQWNASGIRARLLASVGNSYKLGAEQLLFGLSPLFKIIVLPMLLLTLFFGLVAVQGGGMLIPLWVFGVRN